MEAEALNRGFFKVIRTGRPWLAIDADASPYDAGFDLVRDETFEAALDRLGKAGLTRVFVLPGTPLAAQLKARGLVDEDNTPK
jgi:diaminohydroxyphosphoribosylaminopyrimidine deaminase / 5-amino-6-(5-phosphoribosylamino)uracil reductase